MAKGRNNFGNMTFQAREIRGVGCELCYAASFLRPALPVYHLTPHLRSLPPENIEWTETEWIAHIARAAAENLSMQGYLKKRRILSRDAKSLVQYPTLSGSFAGIGNLTSRSGKMSGVPAMRKF